MTFAEFTFPSSLFPPSNYKSTNLNRPEFLSQSLTRRLKRRESQGESTGHGTNTHAAKDPDPSENKAKIASHVQKAISAAKTTNGTNINEDELVKQLTESVETLVNEDLKVHAAAIGGSSGGGGHGEHHLNTNPPSIRAEEPRWRGFMYPGLSVGVLNLIAAAFLMFYLFPHVIKLRRWHEERRLKLIAREKAKKMVISGPIEAKKVVGVTPDQSENRIIQAMNHAKLYLPTGGSEITYFLKHAEALSGEAHQEEEDTAELSPTDEHGSEEGHHKLNHLGLTESHRNEHLFAFYTSGADFFMTLLVLMNVFYSFLEDKTWKPEGMCSALGFGIYGSLNMDCFIVAYEAILAYLAVAKPTKNQHKGRYHWKVWWSVILTPWILSFTFFCLGGFGPDLFWCFVDPTSKGGKVALVAMCAIHYTVLVIVVMAYLPMITVKIKKTTKATEVQSRAIRLTACHLLVHILHYTPGTVHAFAGFLGYEKFWIYVMTIISLQMGAVVHSLVVLISWTV